MDVFRAGFLAHQKHRVTVFAEPFGFFGGKDDLAGGRVLEIPGRSAPFEIRFDDGESIEEIACVASEREVGLYLDEELKTLDLSPLPVTSVDELISVFRDIDPSGLGVARMSIRVTTTL